MNQRLRDNRGEEGFTLVEMLVVMVLVGIISALCLAAIQSSARVFLHNDDENRGLRDARVILDRLGRDVRESRGVTCDGGLADVTDTSSTDALCAAHLQLWIDDNFDFIQQPTEIVTWRLEKSADGEHFDVWRVQGTGAGGSAVTRHREATSLIVRTLFTYDTPAAPASASIVNLQMQYDAVVGIGTDLRWATFSARLRNKGATS
jgi:prepilin-type N-terminal cleavage/methylation domain-containing protein